MSKFLAHFDFIILLVVTIFFIPFFGSNAAIDPVLMPRFCIWAALTFILLAAFLIRLHTTPQTIDRTLIRAIIFIPFLAYLAFSAISLTKTVNFTEGLYELLKLSISIIYLFLAATILARNKNYISTLIKSIIISAAILSAIGLYQYSQHFFTYPAFTNITGTMAQKNLFASALLLMLPFCLYAFFAFNNPWKIIAIIPTTAILILIFLIQSRAVWLAFFTSASATTILLIVISQLTKPNVPKPAKAFSFKTAIYILIPLIITITASTYLYSRSNPTVPLTDRIQSIYSPSEPQNIPRISMWRKTLQPIRDNFFLGVGPGNWKIVLPAYGLQDLPDRMFDTTFFVRPENDYIWILSETGIFSLISYLAIFAILLFYIIKILTAPSSTNQKLLAVAILFALTAYMTVSFFSFPKERIFHSMFLMLLTATLTALHHKPSKYQKTLSPRLLLAISAPALGLLLFALAIGHIRLNAEIHTRKALAARKAQNFPAVIAQIDKAYSKFATLDPTSTPLHWYKGEANFLLNNHPQALADFKNAYRAHPNHIHVLNNLATSHEIAKDHENAIRYYRRAIEISPKFEEALINLGATYYNSSRYEQAYQTLQRCDPNSKDPRVKQYLKAAKEKLEKLE